MLQFGVFDLSLGEIMAFFADPWVVGWVLIGSGILGAVWLFENITDPVPLLGTIFDIFVKIGTFLGFFVGALDILVGYVVYTTQPGAIVVAAVLVVIGFALVMRVISKFPLAFIVAAAIAIFATFTIYGFLAPFASDPLGGEIVTQIISLKWMAVIGVVIFILVYMFAGVILNFMAFIGKVLASTPVLVIIGLAALGIGIVVLWDPSILGWVVA